MARRIDINITQQTESHWVSATDLMSGLMLIFMFVAITYMISTSSERDKMKKVAEEWAKNKQNIYNALMNEFKDDLKKWGAEIEPDSLIVRFKEPTVLFSQGECDLKNEFKIILNDFFPRYLTVLKSFDTTISEIRIEGHASSEWDEFVTPMEAYFDNMKLSQDRTREVLRFSLTQKSLEYSLRDWGKSLLIAAGMSSSRLVKDNTGNENPYASRRVEFRVRTNADEKLTLILEESKDNQKVDKRREFDEQKSVNINRRIDILKQKMIEKSYKLFGKYYTISIKNNCDKIISIAIHYKAIEDEWVTKGWWNINPHDSITTDINTRNREIYFYAQGGGYKWNGENKENSVNRDVINKAFMCVGNQQLEGKGKKTVSFFKRELNKRYGNYNESFSYP